MYLDYFIIAITTAAGLYFHWWLYVRIQRWIARDTVKALAAGDPEKLTFLEQQLADAQQQGLRGKHLHARLEQAATRYATEH
ncbi:hypothetical protein [Atopomonas sediminilitoris]|uniref:hypothetical protein n=1 Tax=Atopomonas sediminilitoris TaxID=2919919 RepID=UPI001F4DA84B|nr:hypothetical protein [Atopomonas sediminilitoris]MCJ8170108.1 hypothetical protein [Atopomonas sediminilitoris]